jgi:hypothetical protein
MILNIKSCNIVNSISSHEIELITEKTEYSKIWHFGYIYLIIITVKSFLIFYWTFWILNDNFIYNQSNTKQYNCTIFYYINIYLPTAALNEITLLQFHI